MSEPIVEKIAQNILAAINAITYAAGYNQDLTAIRPKRIDFSDVMPADGTCLIIQGDEENVEDGAENCQEWRQTFDIIALVIDSDTAAEAMDIRINKARADIQKKLMEDVSRGGFALNTIPGNSTIFDAGEGFAGIAMMIIVHYRVAWNDPYTQM